MTTPTLTIPPLECPAVLLPTPANLVNYFKGLASYAYTNAKNDVLEDIDGIKEDIDEEKKKFQEDIDKIKEILEDLKPIFKPYDPEFKKLEIQEIEWEIRVQGLVDDFSTYVQGKLLEIVADLTPIEINVDILGIQIDLVKIATDPNYVSTIFDDIETDVDSFYDLLPPEYQIYKDKFDSQDFKKKAIKDFIKEKVKEFLTGQFTKALSDLGLDFTLPADPREAVKLAVDKIISDTEKDIDEQIEELKATKVGPFTLEEIMGGEITKKVEISEFERDKFKTKLLAFAQDYFAYLIKEALSKITDAIKAIPGLDKIIAFLTFDFCKFLELIGVPKTIALPDGIIEEVPNTKVNPLPNAITVEEGG